MAQLTTTKWQQDLRVSTFSRALALVGAASLFTACSGESSNSNGNCTEFENEYLFAQDTSMGFSMSDVLTDRREQTSTLTWSDPKDWMPHPGTGETELVVRIMPSTDDVVERRNDDTDCERVVELGAQIEIATADGVLQTTAGGMIIASSEDLFRIEVELEPADLTGTLQISGTGGLALTQTVEGEHVEGELTAWRHESSAGGSASLRQGTLASWEGSVGAEPVDVADDEPPPDSDAGPTPNVDAGDEPRVDAGGEGAPMEAGAPEAGMTDAAPTDADSAADPLPTGEAGPGDTPAEASAPAPESGDAASDAGPADAG